MKQFFATYRLQAVSEADARAWGETVAREQTIECIDEAVPHQFILDEILARVVDLHRVSEHSYEVKIAFNEAVTGGQFQQLINVLYGNSAMHSAVKLVDVDLPDSVAAGLPGPQFGITGLRKLLNSADAPMVCAVLKPLGLTPTELAERAYRCALGGADIVKDDHGLADQRWAPFQPRVEAIAGAVARANRETGYNTLYAPSLNCPIDQFEVRARFARQAGAGAYLVMPGLTGYDSIRLLASSQELSMPILSHPSVIGSFAHGAANGLTPTVLYAVYPRLAGADISIYPGFGGRYGFSREICVDIAKACRDPDGPLQPILPSPGGGMRLELAATLSAMYGNDAIYLFGGAAMKYRDRISDGIRQLKHALRQQ